MTKGILQSYQEVAGLVEKIQWNRLFSQHYPEAYRGQSSDTYKLTPSFSRNKRINPKDIEELLLRDFEKRMKDAGKEDLLLVRRWSNQNLYSWEIPIQAQHFRLPTRLLDWSFSWEYALYFAVVNNDGEDGQFWIMIPEQPFFSNFLSVNYHEVEQTYFVKLDGVLFEGEEAIGEQRRTEQFGVFTIQPHEKSFIPLEVQSDFPGKLEKYLIPAKAKIAIREELKKRGIHWHGVYLKEDVDVEKIIEELRKGYSV